MLEDVIKAHTGGGVEELAEDGGGDAREDSGDAFIADDVDTDGYGAHLRRRRWWGWGWEGDGLGCDTVRRVEGKGMMEGAHRRVSVCVGGLALELHSDLDEIKRVGARTRHHGCYASLHKSLNSHFDFPFLVV